MNEEPRYDLNEIKQDLLIKGAIVGIGFFALQTILVLAVLMQQP